MRSGPYAPRITNIFMIAKVSEVYTLESGMNLYLMLFVLIFTQESIQFRFILLFNLLLISQTRRSDEGSFNKYIFYRHFCGLLSTILFFLLVGESVVSRGQFHKNYNADTTRIQKFVNGRCTLYVWQSQPVETFKIQGKGWQHKKEEGICQHLFVVIFVLV